MPAEEGAERPPVEPLPTPDDERCRGDEEEEVEQELDEPLPPLVERFRRAEVEEAEQVDEQEADEEGEGRPRRPGEAPVPALQPADDEGDEEQGREHVREREIAADRPVHLRKRDGEDRCEEQPFRRARDRTGTSHETPPTQSTTTSTTRSAARPSTSPTTSCATRRRSSASSSGLVSARSIPRATSSKVWAR